MSVVSAAANEPPVGLDEKIDRRVLTIALVVVLGSFMSILDTTIVNVAINDLISVFHSTLVTVQWVSTGYLLALASVIPLTGWASDRFGTKRVYIASIAVFVVGSALCSAAWSVGSLIGFRVIQGIGGGMIIPIGMTILTHAAGPKRVGRAMGIIAIPMLFGPILGPILGGAFVDLLSWRWIFLVNVPIGAVALYAASRVLPSEPTSSHHRLDWRGLLLVSPGFAIIVLGLFMMAALGTGSLPAQGATVLGVALLVVYVFYARKRDGALIDVRVFGRRAIGAAASSAFLLGVVFFGLSFLMPLYLQTVRGQSAFDAGLLVAIQGVGAMIATPIAAKRVDKSGPGGIVTFGFAVFGLGFLGLSQITTTTPFWQLELTLLVCGIGAGSTMMPTISGALKLLKRDEVARVASGLNVVLRVGGSVGIAMLSVILTSQLGGANRDRVGLSAIRDLPAEAKAALLPKLGDAFGHAFWWAFATCLVAVVVGLFIPRGKPAVA